MLNEVCSERDNSQIHYGRHKQVLLFFVIKSLDSSFAHLNFFVVFDTDSVVATSSVWQLQAVRS